METDDFPLRENLYFLIPIAETLRVEPKLTLTALDHQQVLARLRAKTLVLLPQQPLLVGLQKHRYQVQVSLHDLKPLKYGFTAVSIYASKFAPHVGVGRNFALEELLLGFMNGVQGPVIRALAFGNADGELPLLLLPENAQEGLNEVSLFVGEVGLEHVVVFVSVGVILLQLLGLGVFLEAPFLLLNLLP